MPSGSQEIHADGPVLIFGGPYSNLEATEALLAEAKRRDIPPARTICTGDLAAYCADPQETIDLIRNSGMHVVRGNCEDSLAEDAGDCGCGFDEGSACAVLSDQWFAYANAHVTAETRPWLGALPARVDLLLGGARFAVVHGTPGQVNRFVFSSDRTAMAEELGTVDGCDGIIGGHCGLPFTCEVGGRLWHNSGVIGMPANDGTPRAWYSILTPLAEGRLGIEHCALDYDHTRAAAKMRDRGLPEGYARALETGLWPNLDILPTVETAQTGRALTPGRVVLGKPDAPAAEWPRVTERVE